MDSLITAATLALTAGDPLGALNRVALRNDAPALALRGIAMAQLGDLDRARVLVRSAAGAFGPKAVMARARCILAEAEIALVSRDLGWSGKALETAQAVLEAQGDRINAAHAQYLKIRHLLLIGRLDEAEHRIAVFDPTPLPPASQASFELVVAGIRLRRIQTKTAREALARARQAAHRAGIPALEAEIDQVAEVLRRPAARCIAGGHERLLLLDEVERLLASNALIVEECRQVVRSAGKFISLGNRPVLFALIRALAETWPAEVPRESLITRAFRTRHIDETHRARLRVEMSRLRTALSPVASVTATRQGFMLEPLEAADVAVLTQPVDGKHASVLALLADGESWSSSALALALGVSQRTVQRALDELAETGKIQSVGRGRARRWMSPAIPGFPTTLLLPAPLPTG
ncbi:HTH domain-containing protein [Mangrovitalea sediminis]|uniref:HTH domain-containing protein n=1 Tax=Mangrovitalea sediminis TaxID=1982043 RepID=UPI000BE4E7B4|nr:HTH domain-containing protein [Mangrovitalea sediminis]